MLDFFGVWFDRLRASLIGRFGHPTVHDLRDPTVSNSIAISPYTSVRGCGKNLYGFIIFGVAPRPGDIMQAHTPEDGAIELVALRVGNEHRWGDSTYYGVARLSKWNDLVRFHAELRTIYPYDEVDRLEKIVFGLADQLGGEALLRWHYVRSGKPRGRLDFVAEEKGLLVKAVSG